MAGLVTVIVPTYNGGALLPFSIGSVLDQTYRDLEVLVVGDACTDDSAEVVSRMGNSRVRWIDVARNCGPAAGRINEGLARAAGGIIAYLAHSDLWLPHHLTTLVGAIEQGADLAFAFAATVPGPGAEPFAVPRPASPHAPGMAVSPSSVVHRKDALEGVGGWRDGRKLRSDPEVDLWRRLCTAGRDIRFVSRLTVIRFPAASRREEYRLRPHEHASWLERIRREPDLEAELLGQMLVRAQAEAHAPIRLRLQSRWRAWRRRARSLRSGRKRQEIERPPAGLARGS